MTWEGFGVTHRPRKFLGEADQRTVLEGAYRTRPLSYNRGDLLNGQIGDDPQQHDLGLRRSKPSDRGQRLARAQAIERFGLNVADRSSKTQLINWRWMGAPLPCPSPRLTHLAIGDGEDPAPQRSLVALESGQRSRHGDEDVRREVFALGPHPRRGKSENPGM